MSMHNSYKKRPMRIQLFLVISALLGFLFMMSFGREYVSNLQMKHEIARLEKERTQLQSKQSEQLVELQRLSNTYYLEKEAREKHGLSAPGEQVFIVKDDPFSVRNDVSVQVLPEQEKIPIWKQWFNYFFVHTSSDYEGESR